MIPIRRKNQNCLVRVDSCLGHLRLPPLTRFQAQGRTPYTGHKMKCNPRVQKTEKGGGANKFLPEAPVSRHREAMKGTCTCVCTSYVLAMAGKIQVNHKHKGRIIAFCLV